MMTFETGFFSRSRCLSPTTQTRVKNLSQGDPLQITHGDVDAARPRWSPRKDEIVFERRFRLVHKTCQKHHIAIALRHCGVDGLAVVRPRESAGDHNRAFAEISELLHRAAGRGYRPDVARRAV